MRTKEKFDVNEEILTEEEQSFYQDNANYDFILNKIEKTGKNTTFVALKIFDWIKDIDTVELNREYIVNISDYLITMIFEPVPENKWKWQTVIGDKIYTCQISDRKYKQINQKLRVRASL